MKKSSWKEREPCTGGGKRCGGSQRGSARSSPCLPSPKSSVSVEKLGHSRGTVRDRVEKHGFLISGARRFSADTGTHFPYLSSAVFHGKVNVQNPATKRSLIQRHSDCQGTTGAWWSECSRWISRSHSVSRKEHAEAVKSRKRESREECCWTNQLCSRSKRATEKSAWKQPTSFQELEKTIGSGNKILLEFKPNNFRTSQGLIEQIIRRPVQRTADSLTSECVSQEMKWFLKSGYRRWELGHRHWAQTQLCLLRSSPFP